MDRVKIITPERKKQLEKKKQNEKTDGRENYDTQHANGVAFVFLLSVAKHKLPPAVVDEKR